MENKYLQQALEYAKSHDLASMPTGRFDINGENLWLSIVESNLRSIDEAKLEAHNKYIDIQIPLSTSESYGIKDRKLCLNPTNDFDYVNDIVFFDDDIDSIKTLHPGEEIIFTPEIAHAPLIGEGVIKKAIFKVINI